MTFVLPGDTVPVPPVPGKPLRLGPGLLHIPQDQKAIDGSDLVIATKAGDLGSHRKKRELWVESNGRRYTPASQEHVIGVVISRSGEGFRIDIAGAHTAYLDGLSFEGASKRNKPNLKVGTVVYARVSLAHKDMEPELECFDVNTGKAEGFGELKGGFIVQCSLRLCRWLFDPKFFLLPALGAKWPMDVVVGMNGRVWIKAADARVTVAFGRCLEAIDANELDKNSLEAFFNSMELP